MRLIGMLDSPYVRRVAVSLRFMDLPFSHEAVSVFRHYEQFSAINPVVKAPTLVTDDGVTLMDSSFDPRLRRTACADGSAAGPDGATRIRAEPSIGWVGAGSVRENRADRL